MADSFRLLGLVRLRQGDQAGAAPLLEESLGLFRALGDRQGMAIGLRALARAALKQGAGGRTRELAQESVQLAENLGDREGVAECLGMLAATVPGQLDRAVRLLGAAAAIRERLGASPAADLEAEEARTMAAAHAHLGAQSFESFWTEGRAMTVGQAVAYALQTRA
jgi:hypothetical protein